MSITKHFVRRVRLMKLICLVLVNGAAWVSLTGCATKRPVSVKVNQVDIFLSPIPKPGGILQGLVVPPTAFTNMTVNAWWLPVPGAVYHVFLGTNEFNNTSWTWSAVTTMATNQWTVRVHEHARFFCQVWIITGTHRVPSEVASDQPFPANAVAVWWTPPNKDVVLQVSQDFKNWSNTYRGDGPRTNFIQYDRNEYYRALTSGPPVAMTIEPLRLWNGVHYGR